MRNPTSRRRFLGAAGASLILPSFQTSARAASSKPIPTRSIFISMGFGVTENEWFPKEKKTSSKYVLPELLKPLERHKKDFSIVQNLSIRSKAEPHAGSLHFLTDAGAVVDKANVNSGSVSCDQIAAELVGKSTPFRSLVLAGKKTSDPRGGHGKGVRSLSWTPGGRPIFAAIGPQKFYEKLYGKEGVSADALRAQLRRKKSVLDVLTQDMKSLARTISATDRQRLEQYATSLRSVERELALSLEWSNSANPLPAMKAPPKDLEGTAAIKLTFDLITLAMQADLSRVATYMIPIEGMLKDLNATVDAHQLSHFRAHKGIEATLRFSRLRDQKNAELLSYLFDGLKEAKQPDGQSLFDHSMVAFGGCLRSAHGMRNSPMIFAGHGGGGIRQGQNVVLQPNTTPMTNLWFSMLRHLDESTPTFSTSKDVISEIFRA